MRGIRRLTGAVLVSLGALLAAGCAGDPNARQRVTGVVYFQGERLDQGRIHFEPVDKKSPSEGGSPITNGDFSIPSDRGLVPGKYKVTVFSFDRKGAKVESPEIPGETGAKQFKERIPARYNTQSTLTAEVTSGGANSFEFKLD